jgi:FdrA protein
VAEVSSILQLLDRPRVINVGLDLFAESLTAQGVEVLAVDWQPPAGGKQKFIDILDKLNA